MLRIVYVLALLLPIAASAQSEVPELPLIPLVEYFEDSTGTLTFETVSNPATAPTFTRSNTRELLFGLTRSIYWLRLQLPWDAFGDSRGLLEIGPPKHVEGIARGGVDLYVMDADRNLVTRQRLGRMENDRELETLSGGYVVRVDRTDAEVYIRVESARDLRLTMTLWNEASFRKQEINANLGFGLRYGVLLAMILYNIFLFFSIRERSFLYCVLAIAAQLNFMFLDSKHARYIDASDWIDPWVINILERDVYLLMGLTTLLFHRSLLQVQSYNSRLDRVIRLVIISFAASLPLCLLNDEKIVQIVALTLVAFSIPLIFYTNIDGIRRGIRTARVHLAAISVLVIGAVLQLGYQVWHILPGNLLTTHAWEIAMLAHAVLLSLGLAFRYNTMRADKEAAQLLAIENLRKSDRIKDDLLANTSHELRTPVHGINGLAQVALSVSGDQSEASRQLVRQNLQLISASGERLIGLIDNLLDFSAARHDAIVLDLKPVDLRSLTALVLAINSPLLAGKPLRIVNQVPAELPPVLADEDRLHQVLLNLVANATKFTNEGEVIVSAALVEPKLVEITVSDTGSGISAQDQQIIFSAFEKGSSNREGRNGLGLGLAISSHLVSLHGSTLQVFSAPGAGAQFFFALQVAESSRHGSRPLASHRLVKRADISAEFPSSIPMTVVTPPADAPWILVVDDEETNRILITQQLAGYHVQQASSGREALASIANHKPDLVLLDLMMPGMNGYETCLQIRQQYDQSQLPVIIVTARNHLEDLTHGFQTGANDFLSKPFFAEELLARVSSQLQLSQLQQLNVENARLTQQIAQYQESAEELRMAAHQLQALLDGVPGGLLAFTSAGTITYANQAAVDSLNIPVENIVGRPVSALFDDADGEKPLQQLFLDWETGKHDRVNMTTLTLRSSHKKHQPFTVTMSLPQDENGTAILRLDTPHDSPDKAVPSDQPTLVDIDLLHLLDLAQRNVDSLAARLKLITSQELQGHPEAMHRLAEINAVIERIGKDLPGNDAQGDYRRQLVSLMQLTLHTWEATTHKTKLELAEESRIWAVSVDEGRLRTRTFDRYLRPDQLPKVPRWREVIRTAYFVLSNPDIDPDVRRHLENELKQTKTLLHMAGIS